MTRTSALALALSATTAQAADITVTVTGMETTNGQVGCALFNSPIGFLQNASAIMGIMVPVQGTQATCTFPEQPPGTYAIAVFHDANGNGVADTNVLGLPKEQWGLSHLNGPLFRAPRFADAAFAVGDAAVNLSIILR